MPDLSRLTFHDWLLAFNDGRCSPVCYYCLRAATIRHRDANPPTTHQPERVRRYARQAEYDREQVIRDADKATENKSAFCRSCGAHYTDADVHCEYDGDRYYDHIFQREEETAHVHTALCMGLIDFPNCADVNG